MRAWAARARFAILAALRFRMVDEQGRLRQHMKLWIGQESVTDLSASVRDSDEITIMQALSGG